MSFATIIALILAFGLFLGSIVISTDNYLIFVSGASFVMVVGGTLAATFISYEPRYVFLALKLIYRIAFSPKIGRNVLKTEVGRSSSGHTRFRKRACLLWRLTPRKSFVEIAS